MGYIVLVHCSGEEREREEEDTWTLGPCCVQAEGCTTQPDFGATEVVPS